MKQRILFVIIAFMAIAMGVRAGVYINDTTFPSDNFRTWVKNNCDKNGDNYLSDDELSSVTSLSLGTVKLPMYTLKGMEYFTELKYLYCYECALSSLDLSKNTKLTNIDCIGNQLTSLDVSHCPELRQLKCSYNNLTTLDLSNNPKLSSVQFMNNEIRGAGMDALIANLPTKPGAAYLYAIAPSISSEGNVVTTAQVATAKTKGWTFRYWTGLASSLTTTADWLDYEGSSSAKQYKLLIGGVRVTDDNKDALSSLDGVTDGTITFDGSTLTLTDVQMNFKGKNTHGIDIGENGITIQLEGTTFINADLSGICVRDNVTITGLGRLGIIDVMKGIFVFDEDYTKTTMLSINQLCYLQVVGKDYGIYSSAADDCVEIRGAKTAVLADGHNNGSFCNFSSITLYDGLSLIEPEGASIVNGSVVGANGQVVRWENVTFANGIRINKKNFPDETFLIWVRNNYDTDGNFVFTEDEIAEVKRMDVSGCIITDLTGIEYFTALEELDCSQNQLAKLAVWKNTALKKLTCADNLIGISAMDELVVSLPKTAGGVFNVSAPNISTEQNVITEDLVMTARRKGWRTYLWTGQDWDSGDFVLYPVNLPSDITAVSADIDVNSPFFSLDGQRLNGQPTQKGVYIRNGKKVVIK